MRIFVTELGHTPHAVAPFFRTLMQWDQSFSRQLLSKQPVGVGDRGFLLHLALCKLSLDQGQGRVPPDLGSCNFPQPPPAAELTAVRPNSINTRKGTPSPARPAALQDLCPLQATLTGSAEWLAGRGRSCGGIQTPGSVQVYTGMGRAGRRGQDANSGMRPGLRRRTPASAWCSRYSGAG